MSSNIVIRTRYKNNLTTSKNISKWVDYVSKKEKADTTSLDEKNIMKEYFSLADKDSFLFEKCESFVWDKDGDANPKQDLKYNDIDSNGFIWNIVISFPPDFAINNGLITKSDYADLTKNIMPSLITDMGLKLDNTNWYACLHRNTDNPHMHILIYENKKTASKGFIPQFAIQNMKSNISSFLIDNTEFYKLRDKTFSNIIGTIELNDLNKIKSQKLFSDKFRKELNNKLLSLYEKLPSKGRLQYNSKNMIPYKNELNEIIDFILMHDSTKYNYANYLKLLEQHQKELINIYGMTEDNKARKYYNEQLQRLYSKVGNEILSNFKKYQSLNVITREQKFLSKHIKDMKFKSRNDYLKEDTKNKIAIDLYRLCLFAGLNDYETKKVFKNWIINSKYNLDLNKVINSLIVTNNEFTSTELYKCLNKLGYSYKKYVKFKNKHFYQELNYKVFINQAMTHLMYELEREKMQIVSNMEYELEEYKQ